MSYTYITNKTAKNFTPHNECELVFGYTRIIKGTTAHWWGDPRNKPKFNSIVNYLASKNKRMVSAHLVVTGTGRRAACIVNYPDVAWHAGNARGNAITIGMELDPRARDVDYDVAAEVLADIRSAFGDNLLYEHRMWVSTNCPGVWDIERLDKLSYTKYSAAQWGKGGTKASHKKQDKDDTKKAKDPSDNLYRLFKGKKQLAAYSTAKNAYDGYVLKGRDCIIKYKDADVTAKLAKKYATPDPKPPKDDGAEHSPIADSDDFKQVNKKLDGISDSLSALMSLVKQIVNKLTSIFK